MKKIVPFNNVLEFSTDVCEITAISLEHKLKVEDDMISGEFYIDGEYKITSGQLERDKFNFELPFDIALGTNYDRESLIIDIDDFRYELIDQNKLKVNIDLYIDGEEIENREEEVLEDNQPTYSQEEKDEVDKIFAEVEKEVSREEEDNDECDNLDELPEEIIEESQIERIDLLDDMLESNKENEKMNVDININNQNNNINENENENTNSNVDIFSGFNEEEQYATYRVYRVNEGDTIDKIIEKYKTSKEELEKYNEIVDIKIGDKLIIPTNDK